MAAIVVAPSAQPGHSMVSSAGPVFPAATTGMMPTSLALLTLLHSAQRFPCLHRKKLPRGTAKLIFAIRISGQRSMQCRIALVAAARTDALYLKLEAFGKMFIP